MVQKVGGDDLCPLDGCHQFVAKSKSTWGDSKVPMYYNSLMFSLTLVIIHECSLLYFTVSMDRVRGRGLKSIGTLVGTRDDQRPVANAINTRVIAQGLWPFIKHQLKRGAIKL